MNAIYTIAGLAIVALLSEVLNFKRLLTPIVIIGLLAAAVLCLIDINSEYQMPPFIDMILPNNGYILLMTLVTLFWVWASSEYLSFDENKTDRTSLILFVLLGGCMMVSYTNMAMLFLGIETLSLSLYTLVGSRKNSLSSTEAAFKYFLMGSFATGFLLFGVALVYGSTGTFSLGHEAYQFIESNYNSLPAFFHVGIVLILIGLAFKISAVPFHFWAPDVYEGAPTHVTAFMATVVKIAGVGAFAGILTHFVPVSSTWTTSLQVLTVLTLVIPNISAVLQNSAKRMLAYSSVGHVGFLLIPLITIQGDAHVVSCCNNFEKVVSFYLAAYSVASLMSFQVVAIVEKQTGHVSIANFKGLFKRSPFLAVSMTIALLSLAGIPPLAGFFGKYMVFVLAFDLGYGFMALLGVVASLIGVYFYFRVIVAMYFQEPHGESFDIAWHQKIWLFIMIALSFGLGIFMDFLIGPSF